MSHMAPSDEHKSRLLVILGALFTFLAIFLLLSSAEREALSFRDAKPGSTESQAELASPTDDRPTSTPTLRPTAYSVALPEVQRVEGTSEVGPSATLLPTLTYSPTLSPDVTASPTGLTIVPSATPTPGLRRPTRVPRPTPGG